MTERIPVPRYTDQIGTTLEGDKKAALTYDDYRDTGFPFGCFRHDQDNELFLSYQFPHARRLNAPLGDFHLHTIPLSTPVLGVSDHLYFVYSYVWVGIGQELPAIAGWNTGTKTVTISAAGQHIHTYFDIFDNIAAPVPDTYSSFLFIKLKREGTNVLDTFNVDKTTPGTAAANLALMGLDCHMLVDRLGSFYEYSD